MNNEKAKQLLAILERFPAAHDQVMWVRVPAEVGVVTAQLATEPVCGTTLCAAGFVAALNAPAGTIFAHSHDFSMFVPVGEEDGYGYYYRLGSDMGTVVYSYEPVEPSEEMTVYEGWNIKNFASEQLEITEEQIWYVFSSKRTPGELIRSIRYLMDHPHATLRELTGTCSD